MKVSGYTIIKNGVKYDYPFIESIRSILPLVDEMIVAVGKSEDNTLEKIAELEEPKIKIVETVWDENIRTGGHILAVESNKAKTFVSKDADWLLYIQADEVIDEKYYDEITRVLLKYRHDQEVEGVLFKYKHFYGAYRFIADGIRWYKHEIRVIKNDPQIQSYKDAQGFRKNGRKLNVVQADACIYHYGWVKNPAKMLEKHIDFGRYWRNEQEQAEYAERLIKSNLDKQYQYDQIDSISLFTGKHPAVMKDRIEKAAWQIELNTFEKKFTGLRQQLFYWLQTKFGWRPFEYKNYKIVK